MKIKTCKKCFVQWNFETVDKCPKCSFELLKIKESKELTPITQKESRISFRNLFQKYPLLSIFITHLPKQCYKKSRHSEIIQYKKQAVISLRNKFGLSFPAIAKILKYKDHTTPLYLYRKYGNN